MIRKIPALLVPLLALAGLAAASPAIAEPFDDSLLAIQQAWAVANYETPEGAAREAAFEALAKRTEALVQSNPKRAEARVWHGIVLSSYAGAKGGLGALGLAKEARSNLEAALELDPAALNGSAYTSLGTLYHKVPGFPLGFGSDDKARKLFARALELNPEGIDPNYFWGEFLLDEGDYQQAVVHFERALRAPNRPGRELADRGRRAEATALLVKARAKAG
jgi:tetratricopeptide (TPR) repeat protein